MPCVFLSAATQRGNLFDGGRTRGGEELVADLEHADDVGNGLGEPDRGIERVKVQGDD